jgi:hypothetical protein
MNFTVNDKLTQDVYKGIYDRIVKDRSGIHVSDLCLCLRKTYFRKMKMAPAPTKEQSLLWATGFAIQQYLYPSPEVTLTVDGIDCTPDIALPGIEVKSTRKSMKKFTPDEYDHWTVQILAYCKAMNILEYDLLVFFVCGNYAPPFPDLGAWHGVTTQEEVDQNWQNLLMKKFFLEAAFNKQRPPELACNYSWEWEYCECIELCQDTDCYKRKKLKER